MPCTKESAEQHVTSNITTWTAVHIYYEPLKTCFQLTFPKPQLPNFLNGDDHKLHLLHYYNYCAYLDRV